MQPSQSLALADFPICDPDDDLLYDWAAEPPPPGQDRGDPPPRRLRLRRRTLLASVAVALDVALLPRFSGRAPLRQTAEMLAEDNADWESFKSRFILAEGRVVDTGNGGVSHSEGQGLGMLFAVAYRDQETFESLAGWTARTLRCRGDALHAWRYHPNQSASVDDLNNATDGDLYIGAALARAADRFGRDAYADTAAAIARAVLDQLVREAGPRTILLPGSYGFERTDSFVVNPSYYAFACLDALAALTPSDSWDRLRADGTRLIADSRFGRWRLPPDWLRIRRDDGTAAPAPEWPARFSYDAIRVPLQLAWGGLSIPGLNSDLLAFWTEAEVGEVPVGVDLVSDVPLSNPGFTGARAIAALILRAERGAGPLVLPSVADAPDYYSAALILQTRLAWREMQQKATINA
ncbi:MAG TPA: glycosyl hydrolase family 8 [Acetobacteraceae bacterium]|nr:glycosyl hydrolase family 8 [Acetobacteraceae bacterium]